MRSAVARWSIFVLAAVVAAIAGVGLSHFVTDARGVGAGVPSVAGSMQPVIVMLIVVALSTVLGTVVARASNAAVGLFIVGWGIACLGMQTTGVMDMVFDGAPFPRAFWYAVGMAVVAQAAAFTVFRFAGPLPDMPLRDESGKSDACAPATVARMAVASVVAVPVVWLTVRSDLRGQAIGGAAIAGVAVAFAMRFVGQGRQPVLVYGLPILFVAFAQIACGVPANAEAAFAAGTLSPFARVMPLDLVGGLFMGVSVGLGLSRSGAHDAHANP